MEKCNKPIGVFDSGVGGISVLRELRRALPNEDFVYYSDGKNVPYGTKTREEVITLTRGAVDFLLSKDVKAVVIACNTATTAALKTLLNTCPVPVVGIEPAVELGCEMRKQGKVLVMATPRTIDSPRLQEIMAPYRQWCIPMPCPGLMEFVEKGDVDSAELHAYLENLLAPVREEAIDVVALGCTHYPFVGKAVKAHLRSDAALIDGSVKTVRQLKEKLAEKGLFAGEEKQGCVQMYTSGAAESLELMKKLLYM